MTEIEPIDPDYLAEIRTVDAKLTDDDLNSGDFPLAFNDRRALLREVTRLTERLAEYTHWEPTVREEYEHACAERDAAEKDIATLGRVRAAAAKVREDHDFDVSEWGQGVRFALNVIETALDWDGAK